MVLPSRREGYGLVVSRRPSHGTPSVVVAGPDNAAVELIEEGVNGFVAASVGARTSPRRSCGFTDGGAALRPTTAAWFAANAARLSLVARDGSGSETVMLGR